MKNDNVVVYTWSDKGAYYEKYEDAYTVLRKYQNKQPIVLMAVADGIGGLSSGDIASNLAIASLQQWFTTFQGDEKLMVQELEMQFYKIDASIRKKASALTTQMGTTLSVVLFIHERFYVFHVGDSKVFGIFDTTIIQLSEDHTVASKKLKRKEKPKVIEYHQLYQCLGVGKKPAIQIVQKGLKKGDKVLLASDGLFHKIHPKEILAYIQNQPIASLGTTFIALARDRKEKDNVTCLLMSYY